MIVFGPARAERVAIDLGDVTDRQARGDLGLREREERLVGVLARGEPDDVRAYLAHDEIRMKTAERR